MPNSTDKFTTASEIEQAAYLLGSPRPFEWMEQVYQLDTEGKHRKALARLYDHLDVLVWGGRDSRQWPWLDRFFLAFEWDRMPSTTLLIGVLTFLCRHRAGMTEYGNFYNCVREYITTHHPHRDVDAMLRNLEP